MDIENWQRKAPYQPAITSATTYMLLLTS